MDSSNRRKPTRRVVATGVASIALLGLAMGPVGASTATTHRAATFSAARQAMLHAETVDADANELDELQTMIDVEQNDATQTDTETGDVAETPEPAATPEVDAPKVAKVAKVEKKTVKVEKKATHKVAVKNAQSDNDDNGNNNNNDDQNGNQDSNDKNDGESKNGGHHDGGHDDSNDAGAPPPVTTTTN
jgi:outer membrane biosynthesis protein TonB